MDIATERYDYAIPLIVAFIILFNILALITLYMRNDRDHLVRLTLMFICNLSISDLLVGVMLLVNTILYHYHQNTNELNRQKTLMKIMTLIESFIVHLTLLVSGVTIFNVTFIRIFALTRTHFRYRINRQMTLNINTVTWVSCAVVVGIYNSVFEFYLGRVGYERYEKIIIPAIVFPCVFAYLICHIIIFKILQSHGMSMKTYLETLRNYVVSTRSLKTISARNLFTASFGRKTNKNNKKKPYNKTEKQTKNNIDLEEGRDHMIIENHFMTTIDRRYQTATTSLQHQQQQHDDDHQQQQQQLNLHSTISSSRSTTPLALQRDRSSTKDRERCRKQVKFLFGTKDVSLLRFESIAFSLCWFPLALFVLLHILNTDLVSWYNYTDMEQYVLLLVYMKSVFTPCLYLMYAKHEFLCLSRAFSRNPDAQNTLDSTCSTVTTTI